MRRKILSTILLALVLLVSIAVLKGFCQEIVNHKDVVSNRECFTASVYVYQDLDSMATKDFFAFWIRVHAGEDAFCYDFVWVTIETVEGTCDVWEPTAGATGGGSVTLSIGYISIGMNLIPLSSATVDGEYTNTISWFFNAQDVNDAEFAAGFWVPEGLPLHFTITVEAEYYLPELPTAIWDDTATWSSTTRPQLSISAETGGTTNPAPGTYMYNYGESVTVTASANEGYYFYGYWLDGEHTSHWENNGTITVTMDYDHTLEVLFDAFPNPPSQPSGPTSGDVGTSYSYSTSTTDPDGNYLKYRFSWGVTGSVTDWFWFPSGTTVTVSHMWSSPGTYNVRVKAMDTGGGLEQLVSKSNRKYY